VKESNGSVFIQGNVFLWSLKACNLLTSGTIVNALMNALYYAVSLLVKCDSSIIITTAMLVAFSGDSDKLNYNYPYQGDSLHVQQCCHGNHWVVKSSNWLQLADLPRPM
jgi:hypothetical protein